MGHLTGRFFDVLTAKALSASERATVDSWLSSEMAEVFHDQMDADQRHGYHAALCLIEDGQEESALIIAALMHDIGKRHGRLGVMGRAVATVLIFLRLPLSDRMTQYRDHGQIGARELTALGAPSMAVEFAQHHQHERPETILPRAWEALVAADQPPKARPRSVV